SFLQITDVIYEKETNVGFDALSDAEKTVYCIDQLLREMENGGFVQFFHHEAGARAEETLESLERIKARVSSQLLDHIIELFPERRIPSDEDERIDVFDAIESEHPDDIAELDDRFYDSGENLVEMTLLYVQKNLKEFR
ncbi:MAG: DMP19 family protein, partial [Oleibacter sp.]|nr:DMP19 family protein [Thalassolituus sp.]